jgi:hypothetical protein
VQELELHLLEKQVAKAVVKETMLLLQQLCTARFAPIEVTLADHAALSQLCKDLIKTLEIHLNGKTVNKPVLAS